MWEHDIFEACGFLPAQFIKCRTISLVDKLNMTMVVYFLFHLMNKMYCHIVFVILICAWINILLKIRTIPICMITQLSYTV